MHTVCHPGQLEKEIISSLQFMQQIVTMVGLDCHFVLTYSKTKGTEPIVAAFSQLGISFEKKKCSDIRSGPRIELYTRDLRARKWPLAAAWIDNKGQKGASLLCQSMILSCERVLALLLERLGNNLPFWLTPEQVRIFVVDPQCSLWAAEIKDRLTRAGIRAKVDTQMASLSTKIYEASQQNIPVGIVLGERELKKQILNVRLLQGWQQSAEMDCDVVVEELIRCNQSYKLNFDIGYKKH
ncbi:MAG: hypothetical protein JSR46_02835 [Verrucomicrobia bacterium]|nr:hypothetical protein [Verrucomicrobiota bacterium]